MTTKKRKPTAPARLYVTVDPQNGDVMAMKKRSDLVEWRAHENESYCGTYGPIEVYVPEVKP